MKLIVTKEHWDRAAAEELQIPDLKNPEDAARYCQSCVVAQAARDVFGPDIRVTSCGIWVGRGRFQMDKKGTKLTRRFDHERSLGPPEFPIEIELTPGWGQ